MTKGFVTVYEVSDNIELRKLQTNSIDDIAAMLKVILMEDIEIGEEYEMTIKKTEMSREDFKNLQEYPF